MAAFVTVTEIKSSSSATASASVTSTASNALICLACEFSASAPTVTVSGGGTWTTDKNTATDSGTSYTIGLASAPSATGGTQTISVTWSAGSLVTSFVIEFSGMANPVLDTVGSANGQLNTIFPATASLTNPNASDVMVAGLFDGANSNTSYTSPTNSWTIPTGGQENNSADVTGCVAYKIVSASAAQSVTVSNNQSDNSYSLIAAYKQSGAATPAPTLPSMRTLRGVGV